MSINFIIDGSNNISELIVESKNSKIGKLVMATTESYDVVVVGSGYGGFGAAMAAYEKGLNVLVVERGNTPTYYEQQYLGQTGSEEYLTIGGSAFLLNTANTDTTPPTGLTPPNYEYVNYPKPTVFGKELNAEFIGYGLGGLQTVNGGVWTTDDFAWQQYTDLIGIRDKFTSLFGVVEYSSASDNTTIDNIIKTLEDTSGGLDLVRAPLTFLTDKVDPTNATKRITFESKWPSDLKYYTNKLVDKIILNDNLNDDGLYSAKGIMMSDGSIINAKNVILSGGYAQSPALLQRSGIGPEPLLSSLNIPVKIDISSVGTNTLNEIALNFIMYIEGVQISDKKAPRMFYHSKDGRVMLYANYFVLSELLPLPGTNNTGTIITMSLCVANNPVSKDADSNKPRGSVKISSTDPTVTPTIDFGSPLDDPTLDTMYDMFTNIVIPFSKNILDTSNTSGDWQAVSTTLEGLSLIDPVTNLPRDGGGVTSQSATWLEPGILFGLVNTDTQLVSVATPSLTKEELRDFLINNGSTPYHACSSLNKAVDEKQRILSTSNIYACDASVLENFPGSLASGILAKAYDTVQKHVN